MAITLVSSFGRHQYSIVDLPNSKNGLGPSLFHHCRGSCFPYLTKSPASLRIRIGGLPVVSSALASSSYSSSLRTDRARQLASDADDTKPRRTECEGQDQDEYEREFFACLADAPDKGRVQVIGLGARASGIVHFCMDSGVLPLADLWGLKIESSSNSQTFQRLSLPYFNGLDGRKLDRNWKKLDNHHLDAVSALVIVAGVGSSIEVETLLKRFEPDKASGVLAIGIVMQPFQFEGAKRKKEVENLTLKLTEKMDLILELEYDALLERESVTLEEASTMADATVLLAIRAICDLLVGNQLKMADNFPGKHMISNSDVFLLLKDGGKACIGFGTGYSARESIQLAAFDSPFLSKLFPGFEGLVLCSVASSRTLNTEDLQEIISSLQSIVGPKAQLVCTSVREPALEKGMMLATVIIARSNERRDWTSNNVVTDPHVSPSTSQGCSSSVTGKSTFESSPTYQDSNGASEKSYQEPEQGRRVIVESFSDLSGEQASFCELQLHNPDNNQCSGQVNGSFKPGDLWECNQAHDLMLGTVAVTTELGGANRSTQPRPLSLLAPANTDVKMSKRSSEESSSAVMSTSEDCLSGANNRGVSTMIVSHWTHAGESFRVSDEEAASDCKERQRSSNPVSPDNHGQLSTKRKKAKNNPLFPKRQKAINLSSEPGFSGMDSSPDYTWSRGAEAASLGSEKMESWSTPIGVRFKDKQYAETPSLDREQTSQLANQFPSPDSSVSTFTKLFNGGVDALLDIFKAATMKCFQKDSNTAAKQVYPPLSQRVAFMLELERDPADELKKRSSSHLEPVSTTKAKQVVISLSQRAASMLETERSSAKLSGVVEMNYKNGIYKGRCQGGLPDGMGRLTYLDGSFYQGNWKKGNRSGAGAFYYGNGDMYQGYWRDDQMHGKGWLYFHNGDRLYAEFWKGKVTGEGRCYSMAGDIYFGPFKENWRHGEGLSIDSNGTRWCETWNNGELLARTRLEEVDQS